MLQHDFSQGPAQERRQILFLSIGLGLGSVGLWSLRPGSTLSMILGVFCLISLVAGMAYSAIGRDVYLIFAILAYVIGRTVSWLSVLIMYGIAIVLGGSLLRLAGMDKLRRSFSVCKGQETMFEAAPRTDKESFGRQS